MCNPQNEKELDFCRAALALRETDSDNYDLDPYLIGLITAERIAQIMHHNNMYHIGDTWLQTLRLGSILRARSYLPNMKPINYKSLFGDIEQNLAELEGCTADKIGISMRSPQDFDSGQFSSTLLSPSVTDGSEQSCDEAADQIMVIYQKNIEPDFHGSTHPFQLLSPIVDCSEQKQKKERTMPSPMVEQDSIQVAQL
uniref:Uncharacterized protein n=1 Tax=Caenorhabditis japonica TaxID=281687 RepID=A0A8R1IBS8_CAEJA